MIELYPVELILLSVIWLLMGIATASALSVLFSVNDDED